VKPPERRRSKPLGAGVVVVVDWDVPPLLNSLLPSFSDFFVDAVAANASAESSAWVKVSPIEQLM
jgi:hypothetical protein